MVLYLRRSIKEWPVVPYGRRSIREVAVVFFKPFAKQMSSLHFDLIWCHEYNIKLAKTWNKVLKRKNRGHIRGIVLPILVVTSR